MAFQYAAGAILAKKIYDLHKYRKAKIGADEPWTLGILKAAAKSAAKSYLKGKAKGKDVSLKGEFAKIPENIAKPFIDIAKELYNLRKKYLTYE